MILVDTTFLIDLQRSTRNDRHKAAANWLMGHADVEIVLPAIVFGEFVEGFETVDHPVIEHYRSSHRIIEVDDRAAMTYARISRGLRKKGELIGANDIWIAATSLTCQAPLLTRNVNHFKRVPGLEVIGYGEESSPQQ